MEFFKIRRDIPFMRHALVFNVISVITFVLAVIFLAIKGLNLGIDFTGGTLMEVSYPQSADLPKIRQAIDGLNFHDVSVQNFGTSQTVLVRLPAKIEVPGGKVSEVVMEALKKQEPAAELRRVEFVGPQVGQELLENGIYALIAVSLGIVFYLWMRFEWKFGVAAIIANLHDIVIILGFFAFFQWDFSLTVLAGVLAILGYSVNESVVVFDRIRENFRKMRKASTTEIIDNAITRTMSRTIITHGCTQLAVLSMLFFGGETLHYFALALTIGILFSIYSSVFVASAIVMWLGVSREDLMPAKRESALDSMP
ncbi:MAG TPA: protein translocase subunit SecF [Gammaproteobacteria bacterium]|nr:protein translocase subunit SecF [Gammaproteobacteria bacterium]